MKVCLLTVGDLFYNVSTLSFTFEAFVFKSLQRKSYKISLELPEIFQRLNSFNFALGAFMSKECKEEKVKGCRGYFRGTIPLESFQLFSRIAGFSNRSIGIFVRDFRLQTPGYKSPTMRANSCRWIVAFNSENLGEITAWFTNFLRAPIELPIFLLKIGDHTAFSQEFSVEILWPV